MSYHYYTVLVNNVTQCWVLRVVSSVEYMTEYKYRKSRDRRRINRLCRSGTLDSFIPVDFLPPPWNETGEKIYCGPLRRIHSHPTCGWRILPLRPGQIELILLLLLRLRFAPLLTLFAIQIVLFDFLCAAANGDKSRNCVRLLIAAKADFPTSCLRTYCMHIQEAEQKHRGQKLILKLKQIWVRTHNECELLGKSNYYYRVNHWVCGKKAELRQRAMLPAASYAQVASAITFFSIFATFFLCHHFWMMREGKKTRIMIFLGGRQKASAFPLSRCLLENCELWLRV